MSWPQINGPQPFSEISGTVYQDDNSNGSLDPWESGIASETVFDDLNQNGTRDAGETRGCKPTGKAIMSLTGLTSGKPLHSSRL